MKSLEETFAFFSKGEVLDLHELRCALIYVLGFKPSKLTLSRLMQDRTECNLSLFKEIATRLNRQTDDELVQSQFDLLDTHQKGYLTFDDFDSACEAVAPRLSTVVRRQVFDEVDSNSDGKVTLHNFQQMMQS